MLLRRKPVFHLTLYTFSIFNITVYDHRVIAPITTNTFLNKDTCLEWPQILNTNVASFSDEKEWMEKHL